MKKEREELRLEEAEEMKRAKLEMEELDKRADKFKGLKLVKVGEGKKEMKIQELDKKIEEFEDLESLRELKHYLDNKLFSISDKIRILRYRENVERREASAKRQREFMERKKVKSFEQIDINKGFERETK